MNKPVKLLNLTVARNALLANTMNKPVKTVAKNVLRASTSSKSDNHLAKCAIKQVTNMFPKQNHALFVAVVVTKTKKHWTIFNAKHARPTRSLRTTRTTLIITILCPTV